MQALNPIFPGWEYIPDGEPHVFGDRVYLYGSHDRFGGESFCMNKYVCWSAPTNELGNWTCHGLLYDVANDPLNESGEWCGFAPDACKGPDGRYYFFYALNNDGAISVAVSDTPDGNFKFHGHVKTESGRIYGLQVGDAFCFDPAVLVDDDGSVHLYIGFSASGDMPEVYEEHSKKFNCKGAWHIELDSDMLTMKSEPLYIAPGHFSASGTAYEGHGFFEGPSMRKFNGRYYFIYSSENYHELCYALGDSPRGPFEYKGVLVSNGDVGIDGRTTPISHTSNNHGSVEKIGEHYYVFYHRHTNKTMFSRQACAEKLTMNADGTFDQAEITSCGLNGGPLKAEGEYSARIACNMSAWVDSPPYLTQTGADRECDDDQYVANLNNDTFVGFKYFDFKGAEKLTVKVKATSDAKLEVSNELHGKPLAEIELKECDTATEFTANASFTAGTKALYLTYRGDGKADLISIKFYR